MTLFSEINGLPVVTLGEATEIGVVKSLTIDAEAGLVSRLRIARARGRKETSLAWDVLHAVGPDAVLVRSETVLDTLPSTAPPHREALGARVLTESGDERGTVRDIAFDPATGRIEGIRTTSGEFPGELLIGLGDYALVVRTD
ncbi:PRC-barrel domain-containing protein [Streptomyces sp. NBC_01571]|uniref:PRC-barrel domain-containing protein n=1 Tax=Streptomyces sp. NBC_01571 TaxID=2975883 RepID=UPI0022534275|nr:PRC-barrel domain-containing protein [Streptomyces sp. NBC_01571]MCX4572372.1 PRC-barrel domain-containing protein [Streptomyces sp. NBC_01571]